MLKVDEGKEMFTNELAQSLIDLQSDVSSQKRFILAEQLCSHFHQENIFNPHEEFLVAEILAILAQDIDLRIRKKISQALYKNPALPREVAKIMAKDVLEIALPVLEYSFSFTDEDLTEIIRSAKEIERMLAIARRENLGYSVVDELVKKSNDIIAIALLDNKSSYISSKSYFKIIEDFRMDENILSTIVNRGGLSLVVVEKMINLVSTHLKEQLLEKYTLSPQVLSSIVSESADAVLLDAFEFDEKRSDVSALVEHLHKKNKLNHAIILRWLCKGEIELFITSLALLANIPVVNAKKLVRDESMMGFLALYKASGMQENLFDACKVVLKYILAADRNGKKLNYNPRIIMENIVAAGYDKTVKNMRYIMTLIGNNSTSNPTYLN